MLKLITNPPKEKEYGRFFLSIEAPGDPGEPSINTVPSDVYNPADNTRVMNITSDATPIDFDNQGQQPTDPNTNAAPQAVDNQTVQSDAEPIDFDNQGQDPNTAPQPGADVQAGDPNQGQDPNATGAGETNPDGTPKNKNVHGIEVDSTRKYILFKEFIALGEAINLYINKLREILSDDINNNKAIHRAESELMSVSDIINDYMLLKFESNTYTQSVYFYQFLNTTIEKILSNLEKSKKIIINYNKKKEEQKSKDNK